MLPGTITILANGGEHRQHRRTKQQAQQ